MAHRDVFTPGPTDAALTHLTFSVPAARWYRRAVVEDLWTALTRDGLLMGGDLRSALDLVEAGLPADTAVVRAGRLDGPARGRLRALVAAQAGLPPTSPERLDRATLADAAHVPAAWRDQRGLVCVGADAISLEVVCDLSAASLLPELAFTLGRRVSASLALSDEVEATRARLDVDSVVATGAALTASPATPTWVEAWAQLAEAAVDEATLLEALMGREVTGLDAWLLLESEPTREANTDTFRRFAASPRPLHPDQPLRLAAESTLARAFARGATHAGPARGDEGLAQLCAQLEWPLPDDVLISTVTRPHAATPLAHVVGLRSRGPFDGGTLNALRRWVERLGAAWPTQRRVTAPIASLPVAEPQREAAPGPALHTLQGMPVTALIDRAQRSVVFGEPLRAPHDTILELRPLALADWAASPPLDPLDALKTRPHVRAVVVADEPETPQVRATRTAEPATATEVDAPALRLIPQRPRATGPIAVTETQLQLAVRALSQAHPDAVARAAADLLTAGEAGLDALVAAFPGQLVIDRFAHPVGTIPFERHSGVLHAFARFGPLAVPRLEALSRHLSPEIRYYAVYALTALRSSGSTDLAYERLSDADPGVRDVALFVLDAARGTPQFAEAVDRLRAQTKAGPPRARRAAVESLARLRASDALPDIVPLLEDVTLGLQEAAHRALVDLTRADFGFVAWKWTRWWAHNQSRPRMEWLIDALLHEQRVIRASALAELRRATHQNYGYVVDAPPAERKAGWARWTRWWNEHGRARFEAYR